MRLKGPVMSANSSRFLFRVIVFAVPVAAAALLISFALKSGDIRTPLLVVAVTLVLSMFLIVHGAAAWRSLWPQPGFDDPDPNDPLGYSATVLAGFILGTVTLFFGLEPKANLTQEIVNKVQVIYVVSYFVAGVFAWVIWLMKSGRVLQPIRNLALSFVGVLVPIAALLVNKTLL
jgi:hypothetical protein